MALGELQRHPWNPDAGLIAAVVVAKAGDIDEAERLIGEHLQRFPGDVGVVNGIIGPAVAEAAASTPTGESLPSGTQAPQGTLVPVPPG